MIPVLRPLKKNPETVNVKNLLEERYAKYQKAIRNEYKGMKGEDVRTRARLKAYAYLKLVRANHATKEWQMTAMDRDPDFDWDEFQSANPDKKRRMIATRIAELPVGEKRDAWLHYQDARTKQGHAATRLQSVPIAAFLREDSGPTPPPQPGELEVALSPQKTRGKPGDTIEFTVMILGGVPPYAVRLDFGDGTHDAFQTSDRRTQRAHTYQKKQTYNTRLRVRDSA